MEYEQAVKFYYDAGKFRHEPGLEPMAALCRALGNPQDKLRFVHIAGTNGKGSCAAMLSSVCRCAGMKTGRFTSPDLTDFAERIAVNDVNITHSDVVRLTRRIQQLCPRLPPLSFFELVTALAFLYFAEQQCDIVILECGLGGKHDATNIIKTPVVSVIMPVDYDHCALLGNTLAQIAGEKAGIIKPSIPLVCAPQSPEALAVISERCRQLNAPLHLVDINNITPLSDSPAGQMFSYRDFQALSIPLLGLHQPSNAAAVIEAALLLGQDETHIRSGLAQSRWPCRFELVQTAPPFLLDGAHNPQGAEALLQSLGHCFPGEKFCFILGMMADKDVEGILNILIPAAARVICITPDAGARALPAEQLARKIKSVPALACGSLEEALAAAKACALPCCACGSLYFVGHLRQMLLGIADGNEI